MSARRRVYRVSPQERLTHLRAAPFFRSLPTRDLVPFAEVASEEPHRRGAELVRRGAPPSAFHVLVEGEAVVRRNRVTVRRVGPGCPIGLLALLAREERDTEVVAVTPALTLSLDAATFFGLLEERFGAFLHVLRATASQLEHERIAAGLGRALRSAPHVEGTHDVDDVVDRFIALRGAAPFSDEGLFGLWHLARRAETLELARGDVLTTQGEPSDTLVVLTKGRVAARRDDREIATFGPGDAVGAVALLANLARSYGTVATSDVSGIVVGREQLLDVFEDHFELGASLLAQIARAVLDVTESRARREGALPSGFERLS